MTDVTSALRTISRLLSNSFRGRPPTRRAIAAVAKLHGYRLERRWPFLRRVPSFELNLGFEDLLELQYYRSRSFTVLVVGAFDGASNDPTGAFIRTVACRAVLVEPQPAPFERLTRLYDGLENVVLVNAAIDERSGSREFFSVAAGSGELPSWVEQLGSYNRSHILKHQDEAPGLASEVVTFSVKTLSFEDLIRQQRIDALDVLQIDAEGMDALLLQWFPLERIRPGVLHYEIAHMSARQLAEARQRIRSLGYRFLPNVSASDDVAFQI